MIALPILLFGCNPAQLATAQADLSNAQSYLAATTQATALAEDAKTKIDASVASAQALLATLPANTAATTQASNSVAVLQQADAMAANGLATAQKAEQTAQSLLNTAQSAVTSMQTGSAPDVSGLNALGPYGQLAGAAILLGFGIFQTVSKSGVLADLQNHKVALAALTGSAVPITASTTTTISHPSLAAPVATAVLQAAPAA